MIPLPQFIQQDTNVLEFLVKDNGANADLSNIGRIVVNYKRPDDKVISRLLTAEGNKVLYEIGQEEMEVSGYGELELQFFSQDNLYRISTKRFKVYLSESIGTDTIYEDNENLTLLQELFIEVEELVDGTNEATNFAMEQGNYAQTQGDYAQEKAELAATEASNLSQLKSDTIDATQAANEAATSANNAANNANTATTNANNAATNANNAATSANNAATAANNAASNATTQATYAQQQGDYAKAQGDYAKQVGNENKINRLNPVNTFDDIATTYPNPNLGDTVQTLDNGKFYRWDGTQWKFVEQWTSSAISTLSTELSNAKNDTVNSVVYQTLQERLNDTSNKIGILNNELSKQNKQSATIGQGLNIINASQNSPLDIRIEGRTLVNVSQNVLDPAKYYVLSDKKSKIKFSDGTTYAGVAKFQGKAEKPILIRVSNFENKVSGSTVENPHLFHGRAGSSLGSPSDIGNTSIWSERSQSQYNDISKQNGISASDSNNINGYIRQHLFSFNLIEAIERNVGKIPAPDTAGKVAWLKNNINALTIRWHGYGTSPTGNKASLAVYNNTTSAWVDTVNHTNGSVTQLTFTISGASITDRIGSNGFVHFLAYADPSDGTTASTIYTDYVELEIELAQNAQLWNPRFPLYEVDATTEYPNILTTWDENEVMRRYPMVESVQHVQNPYVIAEGENLLPPFTEWNLHANAVVREPYKLELNATGAWQSSFVDIKVKPSTAYYFTMSHNALFEIDEFDAYGNIVVNRNVSSAQTLSFTTNAATTRLRVIANNNTSGTFTFTNPMLTLGSTAKPFTPRNPSYLFAEVKLGQIGDKKDILFRENGDWKVLKWIEKDVQLTGSLSWMFNEDRVGCKIIQYWVSGTFNPFSWNDSYPIIVTKYNGAIVSRSAIINQADQFTVGSKDSGDLYIAISDTDSGWGEHYKPSAQEVQAYFNGWKANGYTTGTAVTNELTGQLAPSGTYTFAQSGAYRNIVVEKSTDNSTWSPSVENTDFKIGISGTKAVLTNLSTSPLYFRISYNYGVTVNSWASLVDGSAPSTNTLAYVSANMAPGFTPYKLSYVLATPQTVVVTDKVEGDLVVNGATQILVDNAIIRREKVTFNTSTKQGTTSKKSAKILGVYKEMTPEPFTTYSSNGQTLPQLINTVDTTKDYYVTYVLLDKYNFTTNVLSIIATYNSSLKSVVDDMVAKVSDNATQISINTKYIIDILARLKAGGL